MLLAATVPDSMNGRLLDMGAGTGAVGIAVADRCPGVRATLAERDLVALDALRRTLDLNPALAARLAVVDVDLNAPGRAREAAGLVPATFDHALANPPFNAGDHRPSPDTRRADAHAMDDALLDTWCRAAAGTLRPGGTCTMILRPGSLPDLLEAWSGRFGGPALRPVHTRDGPATRLLAHGVKGARTPLTMLASLHVNDAFARDLADGTARVAMG